MSEQEYKELWVIEAKGKISTLAKVLVGLKRSAKVWSTNGHFMSMPKTLSPLGIDAGFREFLREPIKQETVVWLRNLASKAEQVYVATDADIEGDVIAWDVAEMIADIHPNPLRVRMRSIDEESVGAALEKVEPVSKEAAVPGRTRAIVDRLIGGVFSRNGVKVGRIKTAMLGSIAADPPTVLQLNLSAPSQDGGRPWLATTDVKPPLNRKTAQKLAQTGFPMLKFSKTSSLLNPPSHMGDIMVRASEELDVTPKEVARALQNTYEAGRMSYPRAGSRGMSRAASMRMRKAFARSGFTFDDAKVPDKPEEEPHDAPYPIGAVDVNHNPQKLGTDEGVRTLVARDLVKSGQTHKSEKPQLAELKTFLINEGFSEEVAEFVCSLDWSRSIGPRHPGQKSWGESELIERRQDSVLLEHMIDTGLGRPSTWANHVEGFLKEGLVNENFALTAKGKEWIKSSPPLLVDHRIPVAIERACERISASLFAEPDREPWELLAEKIVTALPAQLKEPLLNAAHQEPVHPKRNFLALFEQGIDFSTIEAKNSVEYVPEFAKD